jgi:hypothetical protein
MARASFNNSKGIQVHLVLGFCIEFALDYPICKAGYRVAGYFIVLKYDDGS